MRPELQFINRKSDLSFLLQIMQDHKEKNHVLLIKAPSGVGKTALVDETFKGFSKFPIVNVRIVDHPSYIPDEGEYFNRLLEELVATSSIDSRIPSYKMFQAKKSGFHIAKRATKETLVHLGKKHLGDETMDVLGALTKGDTNEREKGKLENLALYGVELLATCSCVIRIENAQKIDRSSLEKLRQVFCAGKELFAILEYTENVSNSIAVEQIQVAFSGPNIKFTPYSLSKITNKELINALKDRQDILFSTLLKYYEAQNGNLRVIVDLQILVNVLHNKDLSSENGIENRYASTQKVLRALDSQKLFLLALLITHGSEVDSSFLEALISSEIARGSYLGSILLNPNDALKSLCEIDYVVEKNFKTKIAHDSVTAAYIEDIGNTKFLFLAKDVWINFYRSIVDKNDPFVPQSEALHWLAVLYAATDQPQQLIWVLEKCGHAALKSLAPRRVVDLFDLISDKLKTTNFKISTDRYDLLVERQGEILYDANWFDEACECFEKVSKLSLSHKLMYADACVSTNRFDHGIEILNQIDKENHFERIIANKVRLITGLIRLNAFRTDGKLNEAEMLFRSLLKLQDVLTDQDKVFLFRSADVALFREKDIPELVGYLEKSISMSKQHGLLADEVAARLALCQHYGYGGEIKKAEKEIEAIEKLADLVWIEQYSILNNKAVLLLLKGSSFEEAVLLLRRALMLATEDGDRLLLLANLLGAGQKWAAANLSQLVDEIPNLGDELAKIAHYNLAVYYSDIKEFALSQLHMDRAASMDDQPDLEFWNCAIRGIPASCEGTKIRLNIRYNLTFIVPWRMTSAAFKGIDENVL